MPHHAATTSIVTRGSAAMCAREGVLEEGIIRQPVRLSKGAGIADVWWLKGRVTTKVSGAQTRGRFSQVLLTEAHGMGLPLHVHHEADESFYVLDGEVVFFVDDDRIDAAAGDFLFVRRGVAHTHVVRSYQAELLATFSPAGTEVFFAEFGIPVVRREPRPSPRTPDPVDFAHRAARYSIEIVGPPPNLRSQLHQPRVEEGNP